MPMPMSMPMRERLHCESAQRKEREVHTVKHICTVDLIKIMCISMVGDKYLIIYFIYFFIRFHKVSSRYALIVAGRILLMHFMN